MIKQLFSIRIPSIIGVLLLLIGVGATSYLVDQGIIFEGRASGDKEPLNIAITNVTPTSFTVLYTTDQALSGVLAYGPDKEVTKPMFDDRDQERGQPSAYKLHHITVRNLTPSTSYYFTILSGDAIFKNDGEPYTVKTAPEATGTPVVQQPITGTLKFPEGAEPQEALVLFQPDSLQALSSLVAKDGNYTLPLTDLRTKDLVSFATIKDDDLFDLLLLSTETISTVSVLAKNSHPVPLVLFGQNYDFTISNEPISKSLTASGSAFPETQGEGSEKATIAITSPKADEKFSDQQPQFTGTALPNEEIELTINSDTPITTKVTAESDGSWTYRPTTPLAPGLHTITIKTRDTTGTLQEFTKSFTVQAQGSQFVEPSVSPTRTPTPSVSLASPTPTLTVTATPIASATATPTAIAQPPTATPTVVFVTATPAPSREPIQPTGPQDMFIGALISVGAVIGGLLFFFVTKGSSL